MEQAHHIKFVFPPFVESAFHGPHLAVPLLQAVLRDKGIPTTALDLNIASVRRFLQPDSLEEAASLIDESFLSPEGKEQARAAFKIASTLPIERLLAGGPLPVKQTLKFFRQLVFPAPQTLRDCLSNRYERPKIASALYQEFVKTICSNDTKIVCFSVAFSEQLSEAVELAHMIRARSSNLEIYIGGSQINLLDSSQLTLIEESSLFDVVGVGNGETTILDVISGYGSFPNRPKVSNSGPIHTEELNRLPRPIFENLDHYIRPLALPVLVTKGCYWGKCTFCDYPRLSDIGGKAYITRSADVVLDEIEFLQREYSPDQINLISDAIPPPWYRKLAMLAVERSVRLKTWSYMMHQKNLDREFFTLLGKAGVKTINFGTESTINRLLDVMKKQARYDTIAANLRDAKECGISIVSNVIPDYPTTTLEEGLLNASRFQEMLPYIDSLNPQMFDLTAGTPVSNDPERFGLDVNKNAYIRTNHGYHSLTFARQRGLTASDRRILERTFFQLKLRVILARRAAKIRVLPVNDNSVVHFDESSVFLGNDEMRLWIMSIGTRSNLSKWEKELLEECFGQPMRAISMLALQSLFNGHAPPGIDFNKWIDSTINNGLILSVSSKQKRNGDIKHERTSRNIQ